MTGRQSAVRAVRVHPFAVALRAPLQTAARVLTHRTGIVLELGDHDGHIGLGEACPLPAAASHPATPAALVRIVETIAPELIGRDTGQLIEMAATPQDLPGSVAPAVPSDLPERIRSALHAAIDTAALDLRARQRRTSVTKLLVPRPARQVAVNALVGAIDIDEAQDQARQAIAAGFGTIKLKVGVLHDLDAECRRIAAVRSAIGSGTRLRLDANGAWSPEDAARALDAIADHDIELIEQPVDPADLEGARWVRQRVAMPIAADESVTGVESARRVIEAGAADLLVIKPMVAGGLSAGRTIIDLASAAGVRCLVTTSLDAGVGTAAALHLAATLGTDGDPGLACGLATLAMLEHPLVTGVPEPEDGWMHLGDDHGLAVTLDAAAILAHRPSEPGPS